MWTKRYDNEDSWVSMRERALSEGFTHYFWASDDCLGTRGVYNGGTLVFFDDVATIDNPDIREDAKQYGMIL